ncbi:MAG: type I polyketide synthase, partial [Dehalococcoidia bacterium]
MPGPDPQEILEGVAVIGMAGRFPGAKNVRDFWENLRAGVESISQLTDADLTESGVNLEEVKAASNYVRARGYIEGADLFDAAFFQINQREVELMDPQHRLFLETAWEALEDAGYEPETYPGPIGVYGGTSKNTYVLNYVNPHRSGMEARTMDPTDLSNEKDFLATRVAYKLNLRGPAVSMHTACSTSLVTIFHAYQSLLTYQCDLALAGGVGIQPPQKQGYWHHDTSIMSPDGHCRPYDAQAHGTVGGNGVGIVVLKRLSDAVADGDHIYAVIKGMALNNDGSSKVSYTAPSVDGQAEVIALAQAIAGVEPDSITFVEGHGTATPLGDPIEVAALTQAFRLGTDRKNFCALGSVKSNIGHLDVAAGVAGFIKAVLAIEQGEIPPTVHFQQPSPELDLENSPFYVNNQLREWRTEGTARRAGVSAFGIGGTNVHAVLEQAPEVNRYSNSRSWQLLLLSARSE